MKCDFCNEEIKCEPYKINRIIPGIATIKFNFCDRTCMIAEKIYSLLLPLSDGRESIPEGEDLFSAVKNNAMLISGCTDEEYIKGFEKFNECCTVLDKDEMEKHI